MGRAKRHQSKSSGSSGASSDSYRSTAKEWGSSKQPWGTILRPPHFTHERHPTKHQQEQACVRLYQNFERLVVVYPEPELHKKVFKAGEMQSHVERLAIETVPQRLRFVKP